MIISAKLYLRQKLPAKFRILFVEKINIINFLYHFSALGISEYIKQNKQSQLMWISFYDSNILMPLVYLLNKNIAFTSAKFTDMV